MATKIYLKTPLTNEQECWIRDNIGPKLYHLHNRYGGKDWVVKQGFMPGMVEFTRYLEITDGRMAMLYILRWS
jgi:hypothetical protein